MPKKKSAKKTTKSKKSTKVKRAKPKTKSKSVKSKSKAKPVKSVRARAQAAHTPGDKRKIKVVVRNLLFFGALFIISVIIAAISKTPVIDELFWILAILTAFVAVAFLIVLLILFFMRRLR